MNQQELIERLTESAKQEEKFSSMTNEELAKFLINEVWAHLGLLTPESNLISIVIDRLRGDK